MQKQHRKLFYAVLIFLAGASYGFIVPVIKAATSFDITMAGLLPSNYLAAFVISALVVLARRPKLPSKKGFLQLALLGMLTSCTSACYYRAVALLPSAVALTLLFQYVWIGILIDCIVAKKRPTLWTSLAVVVVLIGTALAAGIFEGTLTTLDPFGVACGLGSAVFYALFLFFGSRVQSDAPAAVRTMMVGIGGFIVLTAMNPGYFVTSFIDGFTWPWAVLLAFLGILIPVAIVGYAGPHLSVATVNVVASSELPVGVLSAWLFMADVPSPLALIGSALVLAGILIAQKDAS